MISIVCGLGTAVSFATSMLASSRSIRMIGNASVVAWVALIGLFVTLPLTVLSGVPELSGADVAWMAVAGIGNVAGLFISYLALHVGKVGIVAPIIATEGALSALISAAMGESIAPIAAFVLMFIVAGIVVSAIAPDPMPVEHERPVYAVVMAIVAAVAFGVSLFATGHLSGELPLGWLLLPPRLVGTVAVAIPLLLARRLRLTRRAAPLVVLAGLAEVVGFTVFSYGAAASVAVTSVLASQFASIGAIGAFVLFGERLGRMQVLGVVMLVAGVAALTVATA